MGESEQPKESDVDVFGDVLPLVERLKDDGLVPIKIIQPGWGSSGYYSPAMLQRDGAKAFPKGTHMYWDHPTSTEERERPERSLKDLAATTVSDPVWQENGKEGPGLYATAKVFSTHRGVLGELAPHIGISIRAAGRGVQGEAEGRKGTLIAEMTRGHSIDFVTKPGAGGKVMSLFESAKNTPREDDGMDEAKVREYEAKIAERDATIATLTTERNTFKERAERSEGAVLLREAKDFVLAEVGKSGLPDIARERIVLALAANPPIKEGKVDQAAYSAKIAESVQTEKSYIERLVGNGSGVIRGMGDPTPGHKDSAAALKESFRAMGFDEKTAEVMAKGR